MFAGYVFLGIGIQFESKNWSGI